MTIPSAGSEAKEGATPRTDAVALSDTIVRESRLLGADRYAAVVAIARTLERELADALVDLADKSIMLINCGLLAKKSTMELIEAEAQLSAAQREAEEMRKDLEQMRFLAAEPHAIGKVHAELGPLSLWSKDAFEREVQRRIALAAQGRST